MMNNLELLRQELRELDFILYQLKYKKYFPMCGGSVYSMIKYKNKLNPKDDDIDFHVKREHESYLTKLISTLKQNGYFTRYEYYNSNGLLSEVTLLKNGQYKFGIDFNILDEVDNKWQYTCYIGTDTPIEIVKTLPLELYGDTTLDILEGCTFYRPTNYNLYLTTMYRDWKKGRKDYQYWNPEHAGNISETKKWTGRAIISSIKE
jgi:phosphorylcholine metabolism protein LicD